VKKTVNRSFSESVYRVRNEKGREALDLRKTRTPFLRNPLTHQRFEFTLVNQVEVTHEVEEMLVASVYVRLGSHAL